MTATPTTAHRRRATLFTGSVFHLFHDGMADGLAVFLPLWQDAFGLSLTHVGLLVTCFEGVTGAFQIPAGFLGERFGERALLGAGTLVTAASFICLGMAGGLISLVCFLIAGGVGASVQHPLASSMISTAYRDKGRRMALGTYNFSGDIGKFLFPAIAAVVLAHIDWRRVCTGFGIFGCLLTIPLFNLLKAAGVGESAPTGINHQAQPGTNPWGIVNKKAFTTLSAIAMLDTAVRVAVIAFGPFLFIQKGLRPESVGFALSLLFLGGAAGRLICGALAERIGTNITIAITEALTGFGVLLLTVLPMTQLYFFLPFLGAALSGTSSVLYGTVADFVNADRVARAFGLFYTLVIVSAGAAPPIVGKACDIIGVEASIRFAGWVVLSTVPMAVVLHRQSRHLT
jgi:FSR family fosmidomycin resistance protein-like MFS transporter